MRLKWMNSRLQRLLGDRASALVSRRKKHGGAKNIATSGLFQVMVPHGEHIYDYLIRTPMIINHPTLFPAGKIADQFEQIDLLPTLLGALDMEAPEGIDGRNLYPTVRSGSSIPSRPAYLECTYTQHRPEREQWLIGLRTNREKFIFAPFNDQIPPEVYDLEQDPEEKNNIAGQFPERVEGHRRLALEHFQRDAGEQQKVAGGEKEAMIETLRSLGYLD
jgi:arylsulfatase A-like enzyme